VQLGGRSAWRARAIAALSAARSASSRGLLIVKRLIRLYRACVDVKSSRNRPHLGHAAVCLFRLAH
jgi:hypothetical protein